MLCPITFLLNVHQGKPGLSDRSSWKRLSARLKECSRASQRVAIHSLAGLPPEKVVEGLCKCVVVPEWIYSKNPSCEVLGLGKEGHLSDTTIWWTRISEHGLGASPKVIHSCLSDRSTLNDFTSFFL